MSAAAPEAEAQHPIRWRGCVRAAAEAQAPAEVGGQAEAASVEVTASATSEQVEAAEPNKVEAAAVGRPAGRRLGDVVGGEDTVHFVC